MKITVNGRISSLFEIKNCISEYNDFVNSDLSQFKNCEEIIITKGDTTYMMVEKYEKTNVVTYYPINVYTLKYKYNVDQS